jgi:hypothetical protein
MRYKRQRGWKKFRERERERERKEKQDRRVKGIESK